MEFYHIYPETLNDLTGASDFQNFVKVYLEMSEWPKDDLFQTCGCYFISNRLACKLSESKNTGFKIDLPQETTTSFMWASKYPEFVPDRYYILRIINSEPEYDVFLYGNEHLVISDKFRDFLIMNNVCFTPINKIQGSIENYFDSEKKYFWMNEGLSKDYFLGSKSV
jgi:hypothetical protein